jgi:hypothetical protein
LLCKKGKNGKKAIQCENANAMRKCEKNSHRIASLKNGGETGKLIDRSLFRNRIRIALPALVRAAYKYRQPGLLCTPQNFAQSSEL